ncbi:MAG: protoporphyrinogen oxidase [Rhodocyclaceae bacterium]
MTFEADVVVVGAGISGLTAAWNLQRKGKRVIVIEAAARAGGTIGTVRQDGFLVETGPNSTLDTSPLIATLLEEAGITGERIYADSAAKKRFVLRGGRLLPLPMSPPAFLTTPLFSWQAKLALLWEPFVPRAAPEADESVAEFVRRRLGQEFLDYAINPFVAGVYAGDPNQLALRSAFPKLYELEQRHGSLIRGQIAGMRERKNNPEQSKRTAAMLSFRDGMQTLPDALAAKMERLDLSTRAQRLSRSETGGWQVDAVGPQGPVVYRSPSVVIATPADAAARLIEPLAANAAAALDAMIYPPVASVACAYNRGDVAHAMDGFGFLVPQVEDRRVLGSIFSSTLFYGRARADKALLTTFVGGLRQPHLALQDEDLIAATVREELASLLGISAPPLWIRVTRWERAIPQYTQGHERRMGVLERAEQSLPGVYFCANYRGGISVGDCIKSAHGIADRVVEQSSGATPASA